MLPELHEEPPLNAIRENATNEESNPRYKGGQGRSHAKKGGAGGINPGVQ